MSENEERERAPARPTTASLDANVAHDIIIKLENAMALVCEVMDQAAGLGFQAQWDAVAMHPDGHHHTVNLRLTRVYKRL